MEEAAKSKPFTPFINQRLIHSGMVFFFVNNKKDIITVIVNDNGIEWIINK